jgi:sugar phosphate permease
MQVYGYSKAQSGQILSMLAIGMIIGSPLLSYLSNSVFKSRKIVIVCCSALVLGITAALAFFTADIPLPAHYLLCLGLGIFGSAVVVIGFTTNKELFPVKIAGTATGLVNMFPFAAGAVFQPILGYVLESHGRVNDAFTIQGYRYAFMVLFVCGAVALIASFLFKETFGRDA